MSETPSDALHAAQERTIDALATQVSFLQRELEARTEELRRKDYIIADLTRRIPELPANITSTPQPESAPEHPITDSQRWWQRIAGWLRQERARAEVS